jgi:cyclic dehypoxanthinyl futalosine synthase
LGVSQAGAVLQKSLRGERLSRADALCLFRSGDVLEIGMAADSFRWKLHPEPVVTYVVDRNINYSNVCCVGCSFCAFHRPPGAPDAYVQTFDELDRRIEETLALGGSAILLQGGLHPALKLEWYEDLLRHIKSRYPIWIHGFSPPEIMHMCRVSRLPLPEVMGRLIEAGLDSLPGGGAEILVDHVRKSLSPRKCTVNEWLAVHQEAHRRRLRTSATMMFGHVEKLEDRVKHLQRIRDLQDRTGGFLSFICWTFQNEHTRLSCPPATGSDFLRTLAIARLFLDNFRNVQSSWLTQGLKLGQVALRFGANDMGSIMIEENVVAAAGARFSTSEQGLRRLIRDAGYKPLKRDTLYRNLEAEEVPSQ